MNVLKSKFDRQTRRIPLWAIWLLPVLENFSVYKKCVCVCDLCEQVKISLDRNKNSAIFVYVCLSIIFDYFSWWIFSSSISHFLLLCESSALLNRPIGLLSCVSISIGRIESLHGHTWRKWFISRSLEHGSIFFPNVFFFKNFRFIRIPVARAKTRTRFGETKREKRYRLCNYIRVMLIAIQTCIVTHITSVWALQLANVRSVSLYAAVCTEKKKNYWIKYPWTTIAFRARSFFRVSMDNVDCNRSKIKCGCSSEEKKKVPLTKAQNQPNDQYRRRCIIPTRY